jgi:3'(2'), 5'-bisphosphate nucleotidase
MQMNHMMEQILCDIALKAGEAIDRIYHDNFTVNFKEDKSPLTQADQEANAIIVAALQQSFPDIPIVSEEESQSHDLKNLKRFFLVDPLDGTKEFIKQDGKGAFTVNIALIDQGYPICGVIYAPLLKRLFYGDVTQNLSYELTAGDKTILSANADNPLSAVASASHRDEHTEKWLEDNQINHVVSIGSSLKFCLVTCGEAAYYPRFAPTMEWDIAAGHAILKAAGGIVHDLSGTEMPYGKENYYNEGFIAYGRSRTK